MQKAFSKEKLGLDVLETDTDRANFETKSKFSLLRQLSIQTAKATKTKSTYVDRQYESALNYSSKFNEYRIAEERKRINQLISGIKVEKGKSMVPSPDVSIITDGKKYMQSRFVQPSYQSVDPNMSVSSKESKKDSKKTLFYDFSNMYKVDKFKSEYLPRMPSDESLTLKKKLPSSEFEKNIKTVLSKVTDPKVNNPREVLRSLLVQIPRGSDPYERLQGEERRQMIEENLDFDSKPIDVNMNITDGEGRFKVIKHKFNPGKIQKQIFEKYSNYLADNRYDTTSIVNQMKHEYSQALDRIQRNVVVIKVPRTYKVWLQDYNDFYHKHEEGEECEDFPDYLVQTQLDAYLDKKLMREASKAIDESTPLGSHLKSGHGHKRNKTTSETYSKAHEGSEGNGNEEVEEEEDEDEDDEEDDDSEDGEDEDEDEESEEEERVKPKKKKFFYDRSSSGGSSSSSSSSEQEESEEEEEEEEDEEAEEEEEEEKNAREEGSNSENKEGKGGESPSKVKDYREKRFQGSKKKIDLNKYLDSDMPAKSPAKKVDSDDSSSSDDGRRGNKNNYGYHVKKGINRGDSKAEDSPSKKDTKRQESKVRDGDGEAGQEESVEKGHRKRGNKSSKKKKGKLEKLEEKDGVIEDSDNSSERNEEGGKKKSSKSHKKHKKSHKKSKGKEMYIENDQASNSEEAQERGEGGEAERSPSKSKKYLKKKTTSKSPSHFNENNQEEQEEENGSQKSPSHKKKKSKKKTKEGSKEEGEVNEEEDGKTAGRRKNKSKSPKSKGQRTAGRLPTEPDGEDQNGQETGTSKASKKKTTKKREGEERDLNGSESPEGTEGGRNRSRDKSERKGNKKQESRSRGNTESPDEERKVAKKKSRDYNSSVSITKSAKNQVDLHKYREISEEGEDQQDEDYGEDYGEESRESIPEIKKVKKRIKSAKQVAPVKKEAEPAVKLERRNSMKNPKPAPPAPGGKKATEARGASKEPQRNNPTTVAGKTNPNTNTNANNNINGNSRSEIGKPQDPRTKKTTQVTTASNTKQQPIRNGVQNQARVIEQKYNNNINSKYYVPGIPLNRNEGLGGLQASGKGFTVTGVTAKKPVAGGRGPQHAGTSSHTRKPEGAPSTETRPKNLPSQKSFVVKKTNVSPILKPQGTLSRGGSLQIKKGGEIGRPEEEDMFNEEMEYLEEQEGDQEGVENNGQNNEQFDLDRFLNDLQAKEGTKPSIVDMLLMAPSVLENDITIKERQTNTKMPLHLRFESDEYERLFEKVYVWHNDLKTDLQDLTERDHLSELQDSDGSDEAPKQKKKKKNPLESDEEDD